jgi:hypothetical protein
MARMKRRKTTELYFSCSYTTLVKYTKGESKDQMKIKGGKSKT